MGERHRSRAPVSALAALLALACAGPPPRPPTAVIDLRPASVCAGDGFATPIVISGRRSAAALSLVPAPASPADALSYRWHLEGGAHVVLTGGLDGPELEVVTDGSRPLHASLTVTTPDGGEATSLASVAVTFPTTPACAEGCADGTECVEGQCLPAGTCAADAECPACFLCLAGRCRAGEEAP